MKNHSLTGWGARGSALLTVVMLTAFFAILTASMLNYTLTERRGNERNRLILRTKNASENISSYAAEQITTKLYRLRSASPIAFIGGRNQVALPPSNILGAADPTYTRGSSRMEVYAGLTSSTGLRFINPATNPADANAGLQVNTANVPIIAKATGNHPSLGDVVSYSQQNLAVDFVPLFQFAVFYNMNLEVWPGANLTIAGPVHANGEVNARCQTGFAATIEFLDRVSTPKGFYADANRQGVYTNNLGARDSGAGGTGPVLFHHSTTATATDVKSSTGVWRDHKYGQATETTTTQNNFKVFATNTYGINLRTSTHGVTELKLPSVSDYAQSDDPATPEDERDNGRQIIAHPEAGDSAGLKEMRISRRAGLYIIVNPDDEVRNGYLPDGSTVAMRARSYRCFLNTVNEDLSHKIDEVVLPGQPSYGPLNAWENRLPNRFITTTAVGHNQVLRTIQGAAPDASNSGYAVGVAPTIAAFTDAYFYDLRRAKNNSGLEALGSTGSYRSSKPYTPRPIVKIDLDMQRLRMCVERTMSGGSRTWAASATTAMIYDPSQPTATNWTRSIFNTGASRAATGLGLTSPAYTTLPTALTLAAPDPFRLYYSPGNPDDPTIAPLLASDPGRYAVGGADLVSAVLPKPWFDGITIYIHSVDAEVRGDGSDADTDPDRIDSGVRLINGRGPVASLDGVTNPSKTGFTLCTNDAAYIVGHFNADGNINSTATATGTGGYSARYPESSEEKLCAVMADAVTILSQPVYASPGYVQTSGWSDSLSSHRGSTTPWVAAWQTTQPSSTNGQDGTADSFKPAAMPTSGNTVAGAGTAVTNKLAATTTEISACLLVGIVPTYHNPVGLTDGPPSSGTNNQASGGVHNFPRLLEIWGTSGLWIRGSMVAMYESRVAMEPWTLRVYSAPGRFWGLHENLRSPDHDVPLEPVLLGARRLGFKEINATEYQTMKDQISALPH